jgi:hypothetical protein
MNDLKNKTHHPSARLRAGYGYRDTEKSKIEE